MKKLNNMKNNSRYINLYQWVQCYKFRVVSVGRLGRSNISYFKHNLAAAGLFFNSTLASINITCEFIVWGNELFNVDIQKSSDGIATKI